MLDKACTAGRAALGLGVVAIILGAIGVVFSGLLMTSAKKSGFWTAALILQIGAGILGLVAGIQYIGTLNAQSKDDVAFGSCDPKAGPILMIVGQ